VRIERLFDALWRNTDAADEALAKGVLDGDFTWVEAGVIDISEGTGPWVAEPAPSAKTENLARRVLPPTTAS